MWKSPSDQSIMNEIFLYVIKLFNPHQPTYRNINVKVSYSMSEWQKLKWRKERKWRSERNTGCERRKKNRAGENDWRFYRHSSSVVLHAVKHSEWERRHMRTAEHLFLTGSSHTLVRRAGPRAHQYNAFLFGFHGDDAAREDRVVKKRAFVLQLSSLSQGPWNSAGMWTWMC